MVHTPRSGPDSRAGAKPHASLPARAPAACHAAAQARVRIAIELRSGTFSLGPEQGQLLIRTFKGGVGARLAHDLVLSPARWSGRLDLDVDDPAACAVVIELDPSSIEIVDTTGGVGPLTAADRRTIQRNIKAVLPRGRRPDPSFRSTSVKGAPGSGLRVGGELTILGVRRMVSAAVEVRGAQIVASARISQRDFGITPFQAMFGAIRLRDDVELELRATLMS